ncbi:thrombospondin type 3 repeat-containing protein [Haladaptatus salinisoli]|uniref:thrombospondin type 3 repeat-containing protein n=1 Tax=Haladaptatus salinisoli TaxID=2884876 RepID=UPI001D0B0594|nr:thrombospondin type 3 repeat-containing protein [Haladaptatus salinisoli]
MTNKTLVIFFTFLLLLAGMTSTVGKPSSNSLIIQNASYSGQGVIKTEENVTYLWQSEAHNLSVTLYTGNHSGNHEVCMNHRELSTNNTTTSQCQEVSLMANAVQQTNFTFGNVSSNVTGPQTTMITVKNEKSILAQKTISTYILTKTGDLDSDSLTNEEEISLGTNITSTDTDTDGLDDGEEVNSYNTDPINTDSDNDGLPDAQEITIGANATKVDTDGDGLDDKTEVELQTNASNADTDADGLTDAAEHDISTNPVKADSDGDGLNDSEEVESLTDPTEKDTDNDGLNDGVEQRIGTNPTQKDTDNDGLNDEFEHEFNTNPTGSFIIGGIYVILFALLIGGALLIQRNGTDWFSTIFDNDETRDTTSPSTVQTEEVLTDEDRVLDLIRENGGRLPQSSIIDKTGWSKSKVSRLLSKMEDSQQISKINIGRKNIVILYGEDLETQNSQQEEDQ